MRKYKNLLFIILILIVVCFVLNSRRMSQSDFELLVLIEQTEIMEVCNNRLIAMQKNPNVNFDNVDYNDRLYYNYNVSKYGI
jgi:hypothetical protein